MGQLRVFQDSDGDIVVVVHGDDGDGFIAQSASVEFCTCGSGGGASPNTYDALINLMKAIELDNESNPRRAGDL